MDDVTLTAVVERKQDDLPRFVVVPDRLIAAWGLEGTTMLEVRFGDDPTLVRRSIVRWPERDGWFVTITEEHVERFGAETGTKVRLTLRRADEGPPPELQAALDEAPDAKARFEAMPPSHRREWCEHVREAKQAATRARRAAKVIEALRR